MKPVLLSTEEKQRFEQDGFLVIPEAIPKSLQRNPGNAIEQLVASDPNSPHNESDILGFDSSFLELIDLPTVFPEDPGASWMEYLGKSFAIHFLPYKGRD